MDVNKLVEVPIEPGERRNVREALEIRLDVARGRFRIRPRIMREVDRILNHPTYPVPLKICKKPEDGFTFVLNPRLSGPVTLTVDKKGVGQIATTGFFKHQYTKKGVHGVAVVPLVYHLTEGLFSFYAPPSAFTMKKKRGW